MKKISELVKCDLDIDIFGVADDSRNIKEGYLFVATKGYNVDHFDYINEAISNGCVAVIADREVVCNVPVIVIDNINDIYFDICSSFYDVCLDEFNFVGITGTDGKTTTATLIHHVIPNSAYIGTNGVEVNGKQFNTGNTTPCIAEFYECLKIIKNEKCTCVIIEVSSEALLHNRLKKVKFDIVGFTNITEDHLNVHKTIENYRNCKSKILTLLKNDGKVVYNGDDESCLAICKGKGVSFGFDECNDYIITNVNKNINDVKFDLLKNDLCEYKLNTKLKGNYNIYNVTMAFLISCFLGYSNKFVIDKLAKINFIKGRGERLYFGQNFEIVLDYAHTYKGIRSILESVSKKKIVVTGAAGGREKEKRSKIGNLILEMADLAIFTMDDPRFERVDDIIDQMVGNTNKDYLRIIDRKEAIYKAFDVADDDSCVLVLGKGRDNYMAIEDRKEEYCDYDVIKSYFNKK